MSAMTMELDNGRHGVWIVTEGQRVLVATCANARAAIAKCCELMERAEPYNDAPPQPAAPLFN